MAIQSLNPATGELLKSYTEATPAQVAAILQKAEAVFQGWRRTGFSERSRYMKKAAQILRQRKAEYAELMALEMGKPLAQGEAEVEKCAWCCEFYAENAEAFLKEKEIATDASKSFVTYQPLGVILAVMPWNFPFWQVFRFACPTLMAGNAGVLKHSTNVPGCGVAIEEIFNLAGFPVNLFSNLLLENRSVKQVIENPIVKAVTLTGSTRAGQAVASEAGAVLKKTVLELGGSDPYLILEDADLETAADTCVTSRLINGGQSCIAAKRFIVVQPLKKDFEELFVRKMQSKKMGSPMERVDLGPQARADLRDDLHRQVAESIQKGARLLLGGKVPEGPGAFYPPTVLTDVRKGMAAYDEELFGPVAAIIAAEDEEDAIRIANDSVFGLGAAVFTKDIARGERIAAERIEAGACFVNAFVKSDPRLPFGGIKESGYGRELSTFGIHEFVNIKTVYVK
jgi:succinate-semialdehyde dehydrogenase/glutarate-semialdehyde dehydrogenase